MAAPLDKEQEKRLGTKAPIFNDQRFQDMLDGTRGVRQADIPKATEKTTYTNLDTTGKPIEGYRAVKTVVPVESFPQASQALRPKMTQPTNADILAKRQPGQAIRYNNGGLSVEFAGSTPNSEITAFTDSHRGLVTERQKEEKAYAEAEARRQALNGGLGASPSPPSMPDLSGMTVNRQKAAVDAYRAQQVAYDNFQQNATARLNNQDQNTITKDRYAVQSEVDRGKLGVDQETAKAQQGLWGSQADERNRENRLAAEVYDPTVTPERLTQVEQASQALTGSKAQGAPFRKYDPGTPAIGGLGGTMEGVVEQQPDGTYIKRPVAPQSSEDPYAGMTLEELKDRRKAIK
jgi:hypothetical protein